MNAKSTGLPNVRGADQLEDIAGVPRFVINDPNALTQLLGWAKFRSASGHVYFRGQSEIHDDMLPSATRPPGNLAFSDVSGTIRKYVDQLVGGPCVCEGFNRTFANGHLCVERIKSHRGPKQLVPTTYRAAVEPLLQHYGLITRWLDVVDNIWIALWFAAHEQVNFGRFSHHERRSPSQERDGDRAYVAVLDAGVQEGTEIPGYTTGPDARVIDLRYSVPSVYLRPHAQHGVLMAPSAPADDSKGSLKSVVVAYLEIRLADALNWLGEGVMLSPFVLFPPATVDLGYNYLTSAPEPPPRLGHITLYGPGR